MNTLARLRADALACWSAALAAVDAAGLVGRHLARRNDALVLRTGAGTTVAEHRGPVVVVGGGKAAVAMARAAAGIVGDACTGGIVVAPHGAAGEGAVEVATGRHPLPDAAGVAATARLLATAAGADERTLVLALVSGGASALLVAPSGVTLDDKTEVTRRLLAVGADIAALNAVRKHCSLVKGGGLARAAARAAGLWTLVLSDVVGDDPATIGSGPTVADPTTFRDAESVVDRWLGDAAPGQVRQHLARGAAGAVAETVKPGDPVLARARTVVIGGNRDATEAAAGAAVGRGYAVETLAPLTGDAAAAGRAIAARLRAAPADRAVAIVAGGETTVRVEPGGRGGRAQHLALAAAVALAGVPAVVLAAGTDGVDGPTDAAGACVDGDTIARGRALDAERALRETDSHRFLAATGDLLVTGPTGTNVADVVVALRAAC
ncbi:MAG TPA: DUF4147 domain-containing protein [Candidatus Binatia bacterium]|nr:DUF4147 domain-containing protein [Candidatus Binatia bacterium]